MNTASIFSDSNCAEVFLPFLYSSSCKSCIFFSNSFVSFCSSVILRTFPLLSTNCVLESAMPDFLEVISFLNSERLAASPVNAPAMPPNTAPGTAPTPAKGAPAARPIPAPVKPLLKTLPKTELLFFPSLSEPVM